ncbi:MAG: SAM-dependent methyltransferase [Armatimonadota bacterium]|nr:SAM-dependent methyltransferase [Armatimonadota bacterium]
MTKDLVPGSFRDPSGSLFFLDGEIYRRVNPSYKDHYDCLMSSGLYEDLASSGLLVAHDEVEIDDSVASGAYKTLKPEMIPFISYPHEWCFSQLKDAALATLEIQKKALARGMTLKDCSAYNIQFANGKPVFIDTLSFEKYVEGQPWVAYKQFCQHFLAPLALMSLKDVRFNQLFRIYIDGVPLDLAGSILPWRTKLSFSLLLHIHLHAKSQKYYSDKAIDKSKRIPKVSKQSMLGLIDSLESCIRGLKWIPKGTEWVDYYSDDSYVSEALDDKKRLVTEYLKEINPKTLWDLGANTGLHSRIASDLGAYTVSFDIDPACVEVNYLQVKKTGEKNVLPLLLDLTNPSPSIGWDNDERQSVTERGPADAAMALALIHHLAISNNVPLGRVADYFSKLCNALIIEFVPKSDHKVQILLTTREDIFPGYTQEGFENAFNGRFEIKRRDVLADSDRILYLMIKRQETR